MESNEKKILLKVAVATWAVCVVASFFYFLVLPNLPGGLEANGLSSPGDVVFGSRLNPKLPLRLGKQDPRNLQRVKGNPEDHPETWRVGYGGFEYVGDGED